LRAAVGDGFAALEGAADAYQTALGLAGGVEFAAEQTDVVAGNVDAATDAFLTACGVLTRR